MTTMTAEVSTPTETVAEARPQLAQLHADLATFEAQYAMSSELFYQRYQHGQTDDRMDFIEWASLIQMTQNLEKHLYALLRDNNL